MFSYFPKREHSQRGRDGRQSETRHRQQSRIPTMMHGHIEHLCATDQTSSSQYRILDVVSQVACFYCIGGTFDQIDT